jgi:CheY-like chemotaxis protein
VAPPASIEPAEQIGQGEMILVVEDEPVIMEIFKEMLERLGYLVVLAGSPSTAISSLKEHYEDIQLLITDVVMPEMNGRELERRLKEDKPGLKCLFTSGYTSEVIARHGVLDRDVCFLQKPFSYSELSAKVRLALTQP